MKKNNQLQIQPNQLSNETVSSLKVRLLSSLIAILIVVPNVIVGDLFFAVAMAFLQCVAIFEIIRCSGQKNSLVLYIFSYAIAFCLTYFPLVANITDWSSWRVFAGFSSIRISITVIMIAAFLLFFNVVLDKNFTVRDACFIFTMIILISIGFQGILYLRYFPNYIYHETIGASANYFNWYDNFEASSLAVMIVAASLLTDTGAYFFGIFFGHKKINERISQKKTWAGFFGGIFTSAICSMVFAFSLAACGHPVGGIFTLDRWYHIVIISLALPFIATLGDFVFSSIKRYYGIKDFGKIIPGHGGVLDRIDSLVFACFFAAVYITIFFGPANGGGFTLP